MKIVIGRWLVLIASVAALRIAGTEPPLARPEDAGMSGERLARIDSWLGGLVENKQAAGVVSLVYSSILK